jgi:hypothetical protein
MEINDERIKKRVFEMSKTQDGLREKHYSWLKNVVTLAVGLFGIIISFKGENTDSELKHNFFILSISALGLGIIFGVAVLYGEVNVISKTKKVQGEHIIKMLDDEKVDIITNINPDKIYKLLEKGCIITFLFAIINLILYSSLN